MIFLNPIVDGIHTWLSVDAFEHVKKRPYLTSEKIRLSPRNKKFILIATLSIMAILCEMGRSEVYDP